MINILVMYLIENVTTLYVSNYPNKNKIITIDGTFPDTKPEDIVKLSDKIYNLRVFT